MFRSKKLIFLLLFVILNFHCNDLGNNGNGSGSGIGNPKVVTCTILTAENKPAKNAKVIACPVDYLVGENGIDYSKVCTTSTDENGIFSFDSLHELSYNIEVLRGDLQSVLIQYKNDTLNTNDVNLGEKKLDKNQVVEGEINLLGGPKAKKIIQLYGLTRRVETPISKKYNFSITVPKGVYTARISTDSDEYTPYETQLTTNEMILNLLAKYPISDSWLCDSLIVELALFLNNQAHLDIHTLSTQKNGRLHSLKFEGNKFNDIIFIIGGLNTLRELTITETSISYLPAELYFLENLQKLSLTKNRSLTTLPNELHKLKKVTYLDLSKNNLKTLPPDVQLWADRLDPDWKDTQQ